MSPAGELSLRAFIADADAGDRVRLSIFLREMPHVEIVGEAGDGIDAVAGIGAMRPEMVFLGRDLERAAGSEVLDAIADLGVPGLVLLLEEPPDPDPDGPDGIAHLLRPVQREPVLEVVNRLRPRLHQPSRLDTQCLRAAVELLRPHRAPQRLVIRAQGRVDVVPTAEIDWIGAAANYVQIHAGTRSFLMRTTMREMEDRLDGTGFVRIHRSIIVNADRIRHVRPWYHGDAVVVLEDGTRLNLSRSYRRRLETFLARSGRHAV